MKTIILIFLGTMSASFMIAYISTFSKLKKTNFALAKLFIENEGLKDIKIKVSNNVDLTDDAMHKENFIKFLSDSRDWAFEYIESSQKTIEEVSEELKSKGLDDYSNRLMSLLPEKQIKE
jgi:hypothetical protein